ncbi:unnamed protein product [Paramecium sonneborni]|uniref:Uncharacterized protein n=1 Tax=Paramecium sonneborni TaxID=65129 RepID=A0A8S1R5J6_9CILI|nr:unnamed protein product [Paramecium sonneborni]
MATCIYLKHELFYKIQKRKIGFHLFQKKQFQQQCNILKSIIGNQKLTIYTSTNPQNDCQYQYENLQNGDTNQMEIYKFGLQKKMMMRYGKHSMKKLKKYNYLSCQIVLFQIKIQFLEDVIVIQLRVENLNLLRSWYKQQQ